MQKRDVWLQNGVLEGPAWVPPIPQMVMMSASFADNTDSTWDTYLFVSS